MNKFTLPKEAVLEQLKKMLPSQLEKEMKQKAGKNIKVIDLEWDEKGLIIYYKGDKLS